MIPFYNIEATKNFLTTDFNSYQLINYPNQTTFYYNFESNHSSYFQFHPNFFQTPANFCFPPSLKDSIQNLPLKHKCYQENPTICQQNIESSRRDQLKVTVPKIKNLKKQEKYKYLKKNTESNITNQIITFLVNQQKSQQYLLNICNKLNLKKQIFILKFYQWMKIIKTKTNKYVSKRTILNFAIPSPDHLLFKQSKKLGQEISQNELQFFCKSVRILTRIFLNRHCSLTVLTSKKIYRQGLFEHLQRKSQIQSFLSKQYIRYQFPNQDEKEIN